MNASIGNLCSSSDQVLEQLLDEITDRIQAGEPVDLECLVADHPEYADRLQRLLPAMQVLMAFGSSQVATAASSVVPRSLDSVVRGSPDPAHPASSIQHPASNTGVLGDFRIVREIGRGGMGVVYEAEQISIGRPVALKVLPFASILDERRLARFRNEVRAAGQLHHTNIVPVYAVGSDRGVHFYAMQLVEGQSLAQVIEQVGAASRAALPNDSNNMRMSRSARGTYIQDTAPVAALSTLRTTNSTAFFRSVAQLAIQAAEALEHAHSCGVIHRDIKPSNLLIDTRGCLWLTDFGLARIESDTDLTMTGDLLGTLRYMSPEQTLGSRVVLDHRTDIYSLGATLYELLALRPAFDAADRPALLRQINEQEPPTPRRINLSIPADLETIVLKAMAKEPAARYATAQHLADDLNRFLERKPIHARRPTLVERAGKWARRHVALISIAAAALSVATVSFFVAALLTLGAYRSEAQQRTAAERNLFLAASAIDRALSQASSASYEKGDLAAAEKLATDATQFYEELLKHSDDPNLHFRAARSYEQVESIWSLAGQAEKARDAARRATALLQSLVAQFPQNPDYLAARAYAYGNIASAHFQLYEFAASEEPRRLAEADFQTLVHRFPQDLEYQAGLAGAIGIRGDTCAMLGRPEEAEDCYRSAAAIFGNLPESFFTKYPDAITRHAGLYSNWSIICRGRGEFDRAIDLAERAITLERRSLEEWPTNPMARDFLFKHLKTLSEAQLCGGRPADAARTIETLVAEFSDRLSAYETAVNTLLSCAKLAAVNSFQSDTEVRTPDTGHLAPSASGDAYYQRAHELVALARDATTRAADALDGFAWFLLICDDQSFRDPVWALELAKDAVKQTPGRGGAWLTLALAHYRNGNWAAAEKAEEQAINISTEGQAVGYHRVMMAMIRWQQGRKTEARQFLREAHDWIGNAEWVYEHVHRLAAEADKLIEAEDSPVPDEAIDHPSVREPRNESGRHPPST